MLHHDTEQLEKTCTGLMGGFKNRLAWKWDNRFGTALAEFEVLDKDAIVQILSGHLEEVWDTGSLPRAPEAVQNIIDSLGGLQPGQKLFVTNREALVFCAWWPWGNGRTISIRLGVSMDSLSPEDHDALTLLFRGWLNL